MGLTTVQTNNYTLDEPTRKSEGDRSYTVRALTCDLERSYVGSVERGERNLSLVHIHKIARALGVPMKELF
jgi:transcriptional regulator with XRE-family HTH domain